jgi:hypothetical protein
LENRRVLGVVEWQSLGHRMYRTAVQWTRRRQGNTEARNHRLRLFNLFLQLKLHCAVERDGVLALKMFQFRTPNVDRLHVIHGIGFCRRLADPIIAAD